MDTERRFFGHRPETGGKEDLFSEVGPFRLPCLTVIVFRRNKRGIGVREVFPSRMHFNSFLQSPKNVVAFA